jgi:hypothetical protein
VVTDHQRRLRFAGRALPPLQNLSVRPAVLLTTTYIEVTLETNTRISLDRRSAPYDALWTTRRPVEPLDESH